MALLEIIPFAPLHVLTMNSHLSFTKITKTYSEAYEITYCCWQQVKARAPKRKASCGGPTVGFIKPTVTGCIEMKRTRCFNPKHAKWDQVWKEMICASLHDEAAL